MKDHTTVAVQFGNRVRKLRLRLGLSQEKFAASCGLDRTYISSLERGRRNVSLKNIAIIAQALGVTLAELFEGIRCDDE
jgi:transcriptional regulator with XRE-family HTH domain